MRSITQRNGVCPAVAASSPCKATEPCKTRVSASAITSLRPVCGRAASEITKAVVFLLLFVSTFLLGAQGQAFAAWPIDSHEQVSLGYLDRYASSTGEYAHHGIDIPAEAGVVVCAPASGEISFVGSIPADEGSGQPTMLGVSIRMGDGRVVTLMPFCDASVAVGDAVREGDALGTLAASGDRSSPATHLHMGLKRGRVYCNPMELLGGAEPVEESEVESVPVAVAPLATPALAETAPAPAAETVVPMAKGAVEPAEAPSISSPISADALEGYRESLGHVEDGAGFFSPALGKISAILAGFRRAAAALLASIGARALVVTLLGAALFFLAIRTLSKRSRARVRSESGSLERRSSAEQKRNLPLRTARLLAGKRPLAN